MNRPRYTREQLRLRPKVKDWDAWISCLFFKQVASKKRPPAHYRRMLRDRAEGASYREIGEKYGGVSAMQARYMLVDAFVFQETGQI